MSRQIRMNSYVFPIVQFYIWDKITASGTCGWQAERCKTRENPKKGGGEKKLQAAPTLSSAVEASSHLHLVTDARRFAPSTSFSNLRLLLRQHNAAPWTSHECKKVAKPTSVACQRKQFEEPLNILHKYFWTFSHVFTVKQNTPVHILLSQRTILLDLVS